MTATKQKIALFIAAVFALISALIMIPAISASAFTESRSVKLGDFLSLYDQQYSDCCIKKEWVISDESVVSLISKPSSTNIVVQGIKLGTTTVICKTYYTEYVTGYDKNTGKYYPTTQTSMIYSTYNITVVEDTVEDIELTFDEAQIGLNENEKGQAELVTGARRILQTSRANESLVWSSSDRNVVDVDCMGCIAAVKPGTATITACDPFGGKISKKITVKSLADSGYTPIKTVAELKAISGKAGKYYLANDLDLKGEAVSILLKGDFNGQNHVISNLKGSTALFYTDKTTDTPCSIENLTLKNCVVNSDDSSALLANIPSTGDSKLISDCHVIGGSVTAVKDAAAICSGSVATFSYDSNGVTLKENRVTDCRIIFCTSSADITGGKCVGGIAAFNCGSMVFCENIGKITLNSDSEQSTYTGAGGIVGSSNDALAADRFTSVVYPASKLLYCTNYGDVSGVITGGIIGNNHRAYTIDRCVNYGNVHADSTLYSGSKTLYAGGIAGREYYGYGNSYYHIENCMNRGDIIGNDTKSDCHLGGLVGHFFINGNYGYNSTPVSYCVNTGKLTFDVNYRSDSGSGSVAGYAVATYFSNYMCKYCYSQYGNKLCGTTSNTSSTLLSSYSDTVTTDLIKDVPVFWDSGNKWSYSDKGDDLPILTMERGGEYSHGILYPISYKLNGGAFASGVYVKGYYTDGTLALLPSPTFTNASFDGWYTDSSYKNKLEFILPDQKGALTLYAKYTLSTPTGFKKSAQTSDTITLSWKKHSGASGCNIQQYKNGAWTTIASVTDPSTTTCKITALSPATAYKFRIRAYVKKGSYTVYSAFTEALSASTSPAKVTGFKASAQTDTTVTLSWKKDAKAAGYQIQQYKNGAWSSIKTVTSPATVTYKVSGLSASKTYKFRIRAYLKDNSATLYGSFTATLSAVTAPTKVTGFKAASQTDTTVTLSWKKHSKATGYNIQQYKNGEWSNIKTVTSAATVTYKVSGLSASKTYKFRIRAYQKGTSTLYSAYTPAVSVTTAPKQVTGLKASSKTDTSVTLSWKAATGASGYKVMQLKDGKWKQIAKTTAKTYKVKNLKAAALYKFRIVSYNSKNVTGKESATLNVLTNPMAVNNFKVKSKTRTEITLKWDKNTTATGYIVEIYKGGKWVKLKTTTGNTTLSYKVTGLKAGTSYKFRISAYKKSGSITSNGAYTVLSVTTTK